jgi:hypothetical protein
VIKCKSVDFPVPFAPRIAILESILSSSFALASLLLHHSRQKTKTLTRYQTSRAENATTSNDFGNLLRSASRQGASVGFLCTTPLALERDKSRLPPTQYLFNSISYGPHYWSHETCNLSRTVATIRLEPGPSKRPRKRLKVEETVVQDDLVAGMSFVYLRPIHP